MKPVIVWFQQDLRLNDNDALTAAAESGYPVIPVFIWAPHDEEPWAPGGASRWWLHHSLLDLDQALRRLGSRLVLRKGSAVQTLKKLVRENGASRVFMNRRYEPACTQINREIETSLGRAGVKVTTFNSSLLFEPGCILTAAGKPFQVFTPFWNACLAREEPLPFSVAPSRLQAPRPWPKTLRLDELKLLPTHDWTAGLQATWKPGEQGARSVLDHFTKNTWRHYAQHRDRPDIRGTSRLSPHLHWGEIGPRQVWYAINLRLKRSRSLQAKKHAEAYLRQLVWREFAYHLLYHFPYTTDEPLREAFERFPWLYDPAGLTAWQSGRTGYPIVDAGMRELWHMGWMHNRVRMIVASFLTKHLLIPWQAGAQWFWDTLVDADLANNTLGWQWVAGCGADAAPYFRIFNPVLQGEKFDPNGVYVKTWLPELTNLPAKWIHRPWQAPGSVLTKAGIQLGRTYPSPIVDHTLARKRALTAYQRIKSRSRVSKKH